MWRIKIAFAWWVCSCKLCLSLTRCCRFHCARSRGCGSIFYGSCTSKNFHYHRSYSYVILHSFLEKVFNVLMVVFVANATENLSSGRYLLFMNSLSRRHSASWWNSNNVLRVIRVRTCWKVIMMKNYDNGGQGGRSCAKARRRAFAEKFGLRWIF